MEQNVSEDRIQAEYHQWLHNTYPRTRGLCYAIPNGGLRTPREAMKLKATGVVRGIPDYHHAIPSQGYAGLYIEFKEPGANMNTEHVRNQLQAHKRLEQAGNKVVVCHSFAAAQKEAIDYLPAQYLSTTQLQPPSTKKVL